MAENWQFRRLYGDYLKQQEQTCTNEGGLPDDIFLAVLFLYLRIYLQKCRIIIHIYLKMYSSVVEHIMHTEGHASDQCLFSLKIVSLGYDVSSIELN